MIDYTKLPYTERLLYVSHLQKQQSHPVGHPLSPTLKANVAPATTLAAGGFVLSASARCEGPCLEKWLLYGFLIAGTGLLAYGLCQLLTPTCPRSVYRKEED